MASSLYWPATLPVARLATYNVKPREPVLQSDFGYLTRRRVIQSNAPEDIDVSVLLNRTMEPIQRKFFRNTLRWGTLSFNMPILGNGVYSEREVQLIDGQPDFRPADTPNLMLSTFRVQVLSSMTDGEYELTASNAVNIDANNLGLSATLPASPIGTIVTINALATDRIVITKPAQADDAGMTWDAWSPYSGNANNPPGTGLTWHNIFTISNQSNIQLLAYAGRGFKVDDAAALASIQGDFPFVLTGHTAYKFWHWDSPIVDNRGGISLRVETYSLVP